METIFFFPEHAYVVYQTDWAGLHSSVSSTSDCRSKGHKLRSHLGHIIFMEIDHEEISMDILPFPLS